MANLESLVTTNNFIVEENKNASSEALKKDERSNYQPTQKVSSLEDQLEQEVRYRDTVSWSVSVLEQSIHELEEQLTMLMDGEGDEESEFRLRFEAQEDLNSKLEEQIKYYEDDVEKMKARARKGEEYQYDADLNELTEFELAKLVRDLERERNNLYGDLRNKTWLLDNQSQEYHRSKELIKAYAGDLNIVNRELEQIWRKHSKGREYGRNGPVLSPCGETGVRPFQRIIDPRKGPIKKTAGVRSLPRLDTAAVECYESSPGKRRSKSMMSSRNTKSNEHLTRPHRWSMQERPITTSHTFKNNILNVNDYSLTKARSEP